MTAVEVVPSPVPHRLGVVPHDDGATVGVFAAHATQVWLCLVDGDHEQRVPLHGPEAGVWHGFIRDLAPGQHYGFRAAGPWKPAQGHRYNPNKFLLDPYGRGLSGELALMTQPGASALLSTRDGTDSAPLMPRSVYLPAADYSWRSPKPRVPWRDTVIYEAHVKGLTHLREDVPAHLRGTYAGLAHQSVVDYLTHLGVTTLELLPIHAFVDEPHLHGTGLTNYWGYSTLGFFAPHCTYATEKARASGPQAVLDELVGAIDLLHQAGIEVILDVVYNHTAEGSHSDRVLSWKGLDNHLYYRSHPHHPGFYDDTTGTGNTVDFSHPKVVQMAMDSLRYWVDEVGVDGFRFDLAATLGRSGQGFSTDHPFLVGITTDPSISGAKLIAEPWDVGMGGWQTGNFPAPMAEWNDRFRDKLRSFWISDLAHGGRGHDSSAPELATRLAGSSDLFGYSQPPLMRGPQASVNLVSAHDGFTLHDLTAYNHKHNEANGEGGRDGTDNNHSWNHGHEGPTDDAEILAARRLTMRNLLGSLLLAAGTPMLTAGDEIGRTQHGNNNAYCQDNETSWLNWSLEPWQSDLHATTRHLLRLRREYAVLRPHRFYDGHEDDPREADSRPDSAWYTPTGEPESEDWWDDPATRIVQFMRSTESPSDADALLIVHGSRGDAQVTVPDDQGAPWRLAWDSTWAAPREDTDQVAPGTTVTMRGPSLRLYLSVPAH